PFLDAAVCAGFVDALAAELGHDFTYGGYLEDRRFLWRTSYLDTTGSYLHLGIDFNVPHGTSVAALFDGEVVRIDDDYDLEGGWGPRVIFRPEAASESRPYCIFAHLEAPSVRVGDRVKAGTVFARIGKAPFNGNWFPHLHVQTVAAAQYEALLK